MALPRSIDVLKDIAIEYGVCVRPLAMRRTDLDTGLTEVIDLPCGATREDKCPPCAKKNRRLRQAQIREGWHRDDEPLPGPEPATEAQKSLILFRAHLEFSRDEAVRAAQWDQVTDLDEAIREVEEAITAEGLRGRVGPPHATDDEDPRTTSPAHGASAPPSGARTPPNCPGARSNGAPSARPTPPRTAPPTNRRCGSPSPSTRTARSAPTAPRQPGQVRLPPRRLGRRALPRLLDRFW